jgi:predicted transcriptional regulator
MDPRKKLSRRERQIVDVLYRLGEAAVSEVREQLADPPGYDAVRTTLRILEDKGWLRHRRVGRRYLYRPAVAKRAARDSALSELVRTFFDGSAEAAAVALLRMNGEELDGDTLERLQRRVEAAGAADAGGGGTEGA